MSRLAAKMAEVGPPQTGTPIMSNITGQPMPGPHHTVSVGGQKVGSIHYYTSEEGAPAWESRPDGGAPAQHASMEAAIQNVVERTSVPLRPGLWSKGRVT